jgi:exodeoxyribonuclease-3
VRVATFNINNINKRLDNLLAWLAKAEPDVVSLQELNAEQEAFPVNALRTLGYEAVWQGERPERRGDSRATPRTRADLYKLAGKF